MATLKNDLSLHNLTYQDAIEMALDKPLWGLLAASGATHWWCMPNNDDDDDRQLSRLWAPKVTFVYGSKKRCYKCQQKFDALRSSVISCQFCFAFQVLCSYSWSVSQKFTFGNCWGTIFASHATSSCKALVSLVYVLMCNAIPLNSLVKLCGSVAQWLGHLTCDKQPFSLTHSLSWL